MATITCELESSYAATATAGAGCDKAKVVDGGWFTFYGSSKGKGRRLGSGRGGGAPAGTWHSGLFQLRRRTSGGGGMQVFVRTLAGKSLALDVRPSDTVNAVKARIQARESVAAGDQRLVFAGKDLDDGRRTLAEYGVTKEANLFLHLRLRGGADSDTGGSRWETAAGVLATVLAVGAALACFPAAALAGRTGTGGLTLAFLLLAWALAVAGVNLIAAGVYLTGGAETLGSNNEQPSLLSKVFAFVRQNLGVLGVAAASSAVTGVIASAADRVLCFVSFALFLVAMSLVTISVATCAH